MQKCVAITLLTQYSEKKKKDIIRMILILRDVICVSDTFHLLEGIYAFPDAFKTRCCKNAPISIILSICPQVKT
jgi:hypothetical protein